MHKQNKKLLKLYKKAGLKLCHIPAGSKGPVHNGWQKKATKYKKLWNGLLGCNLGLIHGLSGTCCFDLDDLDAAKDVLLLKKYVVGKGLAGPSGKPNRTKEFFRLPKDIDPSVFKTHSLPKGCGQFRCGPCQDVIAPSVHPEDKTWVYHWKGGFNGNIPELPAEIVKLMVAESAAVKATTRNDDDGDGGGAYPFISVYNAWAMAQEGYSLLDEIYSYGSGAYEWAGLNSLRRVGSSNKIAVVVYNDSSIDRAYSFSDTGGPGLLGVGLFDPYAVLSLRMGFDEARKYVCSSGPADLVALVDVAMKTAAGSEGTVPMYLMDGILFDKSNKDCPHLDNSIMMDPSTPLCSIVKSILYHQEGIYNPDMAFWYSLVLVDWLIGGGYRPISGKGMEPLYVFTAGESGDGKTVTMASGEAHIDALGGGGNSLSGTGTGTGIEEVGGSFGSTGGAEKTDENKPFKGSLFINKRHMKNVKTAEGLEDAIVADIGFEAGGLDHGCDLLFTQDEYGLREGGTMDAASRLFRATILDYKTLTRKGHVEPRLLAKGRSGSGSRGGSGGGRLGGGGRVNRYCVHFNYFTTATIETLRGVVSDADLGDGYVQRFLGGVARSPLFKTRRAVYGSVAPDFDEEISGVVLDLLRLIVSVSNRVSGLARSSGGKAVKISDEAKVYLGELHDLCIMATDAVDRRLVSKMTQNISGLVKLRAICNCPESPKVSLADIKWAHTVCTASCLYFKWLLGELRVVKKLDAAEVGVEIERRVLKYLARSDIGGNGNGNGNGNEVRCCTRRELVQRSGISKYGAVRYNPVILALIEAGEIEVFDVKMPSGKVKKCVRCVEA